jgi:hypothetical protein
VDDVVGKHGWIGSVCVALLLAGCGRTTATLSGTSTPTATLSGISTPTVALSGTSTLTTPGWACSASTVSGTRSGDLIVSVGNAFYFSYRELPSTIPLKPLQLPDPHDMAAFDAQIPPLPAVNPSVGDTSRGVVYGVSICNVSTTASHRIEGASLQIASFTPFVGSVNEIDTCGSQYYSRSVPSGLTGGGCGGAEVTDEALQVTFPPQAGAGFAAAAVQTGFNGSPFGFGPLPVTFAPGIGVSLLISVTTIPQAPGTYTFAVSVQADHSPLPFLPVGAPTLFAPLAHKFTGAACQTPMMQQQIPAQVTPALYFACP